MGSGDIAPDDTPPSYGADGIFPGLHEKGPEVRGQDQFLDVCVSGGDGEYLLLRDLRFGAEPVFLLVTVFPTSFLIEFVRA
jgi:hypothetical protein